MKPLLRKQKNAIIEDFLSYLEKIDELKTWSVKDLTALAEEIREKIISVLSVNGGHLSSNLGVVELSIALHYTFSSPEDLLIFDVSHQAYVHKLLTGRLDRFSQIRKWGGLSGFTDPTESAHDHFYAGHAGTALSLALGAAKTRDIQKNQHHVIPILGDASLTCGVTLEALNNIPKDMKRFILILNDNAMSISENVGNIKNILSRIINSPFCNKIYHETQSILGKIPGYGSSLAKQGKKLTESIKNLVSPAVFFEQFGLNYVGPVDGHDLQKLTQTLAAIKNTDRPILLHVMTVKGKGMPVASANPTSYHGVKPFDTESGQFLSSGKTTLSFPKVFGQHLLELARKDSRVVAITPAMPAGSCLTAFMQEFPERCFDVGIAESHSATFAGGMAYQRKQKVFLAIYATFLQRSLDNVFHDVCLQNLPVVFAIDRAFLSGPDGPTHHGIYDIGFLYAMPHMILAQPRSGKVLKELLSESLLWDSPAAIRYPNLPADFSLDPEDAPLIERKLGQAEVLQEGEDLLIIALGHMCKTAVDVANRLEKKGFSTTIIDPIFIKPFDEKTILDAVKKHTRLVVLEEHCVLTGLSAIISRLLMKEKQQHIDMLSIGVPDRFVPHGQRDILLNVLQLDAPSVEKTISAHFALETAGIK